VVNEGIGFLKLYLGKALDTVYICPDFRHLLSACEWPIISLAVLMDTVIIQAAVWLLDATDLALTAVT
jgi:hypothetical protein